MFRGVTIPLQNLLPDIEADVAQETLSEPESLWNVFIHNDDVTPYDFVVAVLQRFFDLDALQAEHVTFEAHHTGIAYVATFAKSEAEKRVGKARFAANLEGYPLTFTLEPA